MKQDVVLVQTEQTRAYGAWTATVRRIRDGAVFTEWGSFELVAVRRAFAAARGSICLQLQTNGAE